MKKTWNIITIAVFAMLFAVACFDDSTCGNIEDDDTDARPVCERNSGYPCTCDMTELGVACDDGKSYCVSFEGSPIGEGWCSADCKTQGAACTQYHEYTGQGICFWGEGQDDAPGGCVVTCTSHADCPPDQKCRGYEQNTLVCGP